ncbi:MAG: hypothetical protein V4819_16290 [Verrucomicrobiota bacterium]
MNLLADIKRHWLKLLVVLIAVAVAWWLLARQGGVSKEEIMAYGRGLPAFWFAAAFLALPLAGFPITPFLLLSGVRFGFVGGMALVSAEIFLHNLIAYHLVHGRLRKRVRQRLTKKGYSIPTPARSNQVWFTTLFVGVQGPPYAVKLYLLALTDIRLRVHLWIAVPIYVLFSAIPVGAGSSAIAVNPLWLYGAIFAMTGVAFLGRWLRKRYAGQVGANSKPREALK